MTGFGRILRGLLMAQSPSKFSSFLDLRKGSSRFRLFARDFRRFRFFFSGSACFSKWPPPGNLQSWVKYYGKIESFRKEFRWTKFNAVERVRVSFEMIDKKRLVKEWMSNCPCRSLLRVSFETIYRKKLVKERMSNGTYTCERPRHVGQDPESRSRVFYIKRDLYKRPIPQTYVQHDL